MKYFQSNSREFKRFFFQRDYNHLKFPLHFEGNENFQSRNVFWQKDPHSSVTEKPHSGITNSYIHTHTHTHIQLNIERSIKSKNISAIFVYKIFTFRSIGAQRPEEKKISVIGSDTVIGTLFCVLISI